LRIEPDIKLNYQDVMIRPKRSALSSRSTVDLNRTLKFVHTGRQWTGFPLIAANMDTIGTFNMARALVKHDAMVSLHKYYPEKQYVDFLKTKEARNSFYTMGINSDDLKKYAKVRSAAKLSFISLDVANGYTEVFLSAVKRIRDQNPEAVIMAGTVATGEMTEALVLAGADIIRVGIGAGSVCITRKVTGVGYPQLSAVIECADAAHGLRAQICADGGCSSSGDIAKAFGAGADFVMLGGMLAGHDESDGTIRYEQRDGEKVAVGMQFYGMASEVALKKYAGGKAPYRAAEGRSIEVPYRGPVSETLLEIMGGIRSMMTYIGAQQLKEVPKRTTFVRVSRPGDAT